MKPMSGVAVTKEFPNPATGDLVVLSNVNKHFGELHVLQGIDLSIARGEVVVVIGPSGGGKSTLCRAINRLEPIDSGEIVVDGQALPAEGRELAALRADVGMVFQSFNLFAHKTVLHNVTGVHSAGLTSRARRRKRAVHQAATAWLRRLAR